MQHNALEKEVSAFRLVDGMINRSTEQQEVEEMEWALDVACGIQTGVCLDAFAGCSQRSSDERSGLETDAPPRSRYLYCADRNSSKG